MDSGATVHLTSKRNWFENYSEYSTPVKFKMGDGSHLTAYGQGDILTWDGNTYNGIRWERTYLKDIRYIPLIKYNLFSLGAANEKGLLFCSDAKTCRFFRNDETVLVGQRIGRLYKLELRIRKTSGGVTAITAEEVETLQTWHERLGHQNYERVRRLLTDWGIKFKDSKEASVCEACLKGKAHRLLFQASKSQADKPAELIHADLCGPMEVKSIGNSRYFLLYKDDFSNCRREYFIKNKSEAKSCFKTFLKKVENETGEKIKTLRTDNGLEFINAEIRNMTQENGIRHEKTVSHSPEQNGRAERENRTLVEMARTLL